MRHSYDDIVEQGRITEGPFARPRGSRDGAFRLTCPRTRRELTVIVGSGDTWQAEGMPGEVWEHVSVSTKDRCPLWEEMCWIKDLFFRPDECVVQYHPPKADYVNVHRFVLHLWRPRQTPIPMPPKECV